MSWFTKALSSTIGQKFVMAITGLLLCGFLIVHLVGNVFMYVGRDAYNNYAHTLHSQEWFVKLAEGGLFLLFLAHIFLAFSTAKTNNSARKMNYHMKVSKQPNRWIMGPLAPETWMFISGAIVLGFLILHLIDFTFQERPDIVYEGKDSFTKALTILRNPISAVVYVVGCVILMFHLSHGVYSAFQSLGLRHDKYNKLLRGLSIGFAWVIGLGFISFVVWAAAFGGKFLNSTTP